MGYMMTSAGTIITFCGLLRELYDGFWIAFIDLYTELGTTGNYSATAISTHFTVHCYTGTRVLSLH
jgi:hypothetical protein